MNRVVITGQGTINALGFNVASTLKSMENGQSGISIMDFPNIDRLNVKIGGQIKDFDPQLYFERQKITFYDRFASSIDRDYKIFPRYNKISKWIDASLVGSEISKSKAT